MWFDRFGVVEVPIVQRLAGLGVEEMNGVLGNPCDRRLAGLDASQSANGRDKGSGFVHVEFRDALVALEGEIDVVVASHWLDHVHHRPKVVVALDRVERSMSSGRTPRVTRFAPPMSARVSSESGYSKFSPTSRPSSSSVSKKFIDGSPMKPATNRFAGS